MIFTPETFPTRCSQITIDQFFDFKGYEQEYFKYSQDDTRDDGMAVEALAKALSYITGLTKDEYLEHFPLYVDSDDGGKVGSYTIMLGDNLSVYRVYAHIRTIVYRYQTKKRGKRKGFQFTHKDETYIWDMGLFKQSLLEFPQLAAGPAIIVQDLQNMYKKRMGLVQFGGENANYDFNLGKRELAVLCRKKGEELPLHNAVRSKFIEERAEVFSDVKLSTLLDLRFFLHSTSEDWQILQSMLHTSKVDRPSMIYQMTPKAGAKEKEQ